MLGIVAFSLSPSLSDVVLFFYDSGPNGDYFTDVGGRPVDPAKRRVAAALRRAFTNMQVCWLCDRQVIAHRFSQPRSIRQCELAADDVVDGSAAVIALILDRELFFAHAGDSRAILCNTIVLFGWLSLFR
jgi:hypothetical protein